MPSRRQLLSTSGLALAGSVAGCLGQWAGDLGDCEGLDRGPGPQLQSGDLELPVPKGDLLKAVPTDQIPAIVDPAFGPDYRGLKTPGGGTGVAPLSPEELVVGLTRDGRARAYPLRVVDRHEVVNDVFGGPIIATYCELCGSSVVVERRLGGRTLTFGVSGYLWRGNLVMYDRQTQSLWSQIALRAIRGPETGEHLALVPSVLTTWRSWHRQHPGTDVLLPVPFSSAIGGPESKVYVPFRREYLYESESESLDGTLVKGIVVDGLARAYPLPAVECKGVINDSIGGHPILVAMGTGSRLLAYDRCVDGRALTFHRVSRGVARAGGSRWQLDTGRALDGPHAGTRLAPVNGLPPMLWFGWTEHHPDTTVYRDDGCP